MLYIEDEEIFEVDLSDLHGRSPDFIFALGVEWYSLLTSLKDDGCGFTMTVHAENIKRARALLVKLDRSYSILHHDDFPEIVVHPPEMCLDSAY